MAEEKKITRRQFLKNAGTALAAVFTAGIVGLPELAEKTEEIHGSSWPSNIETDPMEDLRKWDQYTRQLKGVDDISYDEWLLQEEMDPLKDIEEVGEWMIESVGWDSPSFGEWKAKREEYTLEWATPGQARARREAYRAK